MNTREELLVRILHKLPEKFKDRLVLKGGVLLQIMNSARATQDLDYALVSEESKKILAKRIEESLLTLEDVRIVETRLNSRGIFMEVERKSDSRQKILLEISVIPSLHLPPETLSTTTLAKSVSLTARAISGMAFPEAYAHKIAATLERSVARDLYDLTVFEPICNFDQKTLAERLSRLSMERSKSKSISFQEASVLLKQRIQNLTEKDLETDLYPLLPADQKSGLSMMIKASVGRLAQKMAIVNS